MDRLPALTRGVVSVVLLAGMIGGCSPELYADPEKTKGGAGETARVNAVRETKPLARPESWCDVSFTPGAGPRLELPPLAAEATAPPSPASPRWTWLNLWATWCVPCVAEMELMGRWQTRLGEEGLAVDVCLLSLDDDAAAPRSFLATHKQAPVGPRLRVESIDVLAPWFAKFGLEAGTAIPVHMLVAPHGEVRCVRVGAVSEGDWGRVRGLIAGR